jgi:hypothetical protein
LLIAFLLMAIGVILRKDHSFRSQHISENERMKRDGIHCATSQDREQRRINNKKINTKNL